MTYNCQILNYSTVCFILLANFFVISLPVIITIAFYAWLVVSARCGEVGDAHEAPPGGQGQGGGAELS